MRRIVACGLKREAALIRRCWPDAIVVAGGGDGARLERELEALVEPSATLHSIGLAGALDPALKAGDVLIDGDPALCDLYADAVPRPLRGPIAGTDAIAATPATKAILRARTGAAAIDMESHVAARVAARHAAPFLAIRAISDAADQALPPAARVGMAADGGLALGAVLWSLARRPWQLAMLIRLGRDTNRALRALDAVLGCGERTDAARPSIGLLGTEDHDPG